MHGHWLRRYLVKIGYRESGSDKVNFIVGLRVTGFDENF